MELQYKTLSFPFPKGATRVDVEEVVSFVIEKEDDSGHKKKVIEYWLRRGEKLAEVKI